VDSQQLAIMIWGYFREVCMKWRISEYSFSLSEKVQDATDMIFNAFSKKIST